MHTPISYTVNLEIIYIYNIRIQISTMKVYGGLSFLNPHWKVMEFTAGRY